MHFQVAVAAECDRLLQFQGRRCCLVVVLIFVTVREEFFFFVRVYGCDPEERKLGRGICQPMLVRIHAETRSCECDICCLVSLSDRRSAEMPFMRCS